MMKQVDEDILDDDYHPCTVSAEQIAQYKELSDDEIAYELTFGTTITDADYMSKYKKHNRANSKMSISGLKIASIASMDKEQLSHHKNIGNVFNGMNHPSLQAQDTSVKSMATAVAMTQAAKYYSDLQDGHVRTHTNMSNIGIETTPDSTIPVDSMAHFKIVSYSAIADNFEPQTLDYGQSVLFDKVNKQYFADLDTQDKRHVLLNLHVSRITEIDTVRERFRCKFWISFSWLPTYLEWLDYTDHQLSNDLMEWKPSWIPIIAFPELIHQWKLHFADKPNAGKFSINLLNGKEEEIGYDPKLCRFIRCKLECDMTFSTGFLLLNFPVDCQDLPISIHETSGGCIFVAEKRKRSFASIHTISSVMEEWEILNMMIEIGELITGTNESSLAQIKVRLKMQRRFEVYLWNVVFFMSLISGLTLCSFAVEEVDLGERLAIIITLLLTSVAYQSSVFSTLPNVPYLTLLDKYIVASFVFMTLVTILTAMLGTKYLNDDTHNNSLFIITSLIFIGYHVVFCIVAIKKNKFETQKLYMSSKTMMQLYSQSRERMEVDWKSEQWTGSNWTIYTKYPEKLITKTTDLKDIKSLYRIPSKSQTIF